MPDDKLVGCPYDESHKMKASRLQMHIVKCKLNHLEKAKKNCPFNATHLLERGEYDHHLMNCPDRAPLDRKIAQTLDQNNPYKGRTAVPSFSDPHIDDEEIWDTETNPTHVIPSKPPPGAVIEPPAMSKPAERKRIYKELHQRSSEAESDIPKVEKPQPKSEVIRQPKQNWQGEKIANQANLQSLGLGRGSRPNTRIAANIFENANSSQAAACNSIVKDMSGLGLGRGGAVNNNQMFDENDFPALGCGRGIWHAPKKNSRIPGSKH